MRTHEVFQVDEIYETTYAFLFVKRREEGELVALITLESIHPILQEKRLSE